ncbi:uncharacterized protein P884DRAFT_193807 [Thermothelomyces heterothallicus CBS 202.75]|uniref:uncharacterized protein n=1 Tax=Thermothelomyces heterothallicus CBS 202.75 TaxID=1149848 RepID=UPI0037448D8C
MSGQACVGPFLLVSCKFATASLGFIEDLITKPTIEIMMSASPTDLQKPRKCQVGRFLRVAKIRIACNLARSLSSDVKRRKGETQRDRGRTPRFVDPAHVGKASEGGRFGF